MADVDLTADEIEFLTGKRPAAPPSIAPPLVALTAPVFERAARSFSEELSALLRRTARVRCAPIELRTRSQHLVHLGTAAYLREVGTNLGSTAWLLSLAPTGVYALVDCLLGGGRDAQQALSRPPTEIELRLVDRSARRFLAGLQSAWKPLGPLHCELIDRAANVRPGTEAASELCCARFQLEFAATQTELTLAIPLDSLATLTLAGSENQEQNSIHTGPRPAAGSGESGATYPSAASSAEDTVELIAALAEAEMSPEELADLNVGDVLATEHRADTPIDVSRAGAVRFRARLGAWQGRKAIEIQEVVADESGESNSADSSEDLAAGPSDDAAGMDVPS